MSTIPSFHSRAAEEAEARTKNAQGRSDLATTFLDEIDDLLDQTPSDA